MARKQFLNREKEVRFRVTEDELEALKKAAHKIGLPLGAWVRLLALHEKDEIERRDQ